MHHYWSLVLLLAFLKLWYKKKLDNELFVVGSVQSWNAHFFYLGNFKILDIF